MLLAECQLGDGLGPAGGVFKRNQHLVPALLMPVQHLQADLHIQPPAVQRIVDRLVAEEILAAPQVVQLKRHLVMHVVAEYLGQPGHQFLLAAGCKQLQRTAVDTQHLDGSSALLQALGLPSHMG